MVKKLITALGALWVLDGMLQLQPAMFTPAFITGVLAPNLQNQPGVIAAIVAFGIRVFGRDLFWSNLAAAGIQLFIGALLLLPVKPSLRRFGLWTSVAWALIVWAFGEGFGNLATGSASFYTGAPGAALLYAILALFLLYAEKRPSAVKYLPATAGGIILVCAMLNITPMFWQPGMLSMLAGVAPASNWLGSLGVAGSTIGNGIAFLLLFLLGMLLVFYPGRATAWLAIAFLAAVWWISQDFGGMLSFPSGMATDPNSAPLLALFLLPALAAGSVAPQTD
ncbi:MAG TPA: hypothetical protein VMT81_00750 [Candidatus Paceibacterota bacterium]|nr:hypothetical protein [Candidatus Paceibacterota bacterium]